MGLAELVSACETAPDSPAPLAALIKFCQDNLAATTILHLLVKALADVARTEMGRQKILDTNLLMEICSVKWSRDITSLLVVELCRLGGNLCFDSPLGRETVSQAGLLGKLSEVVPGVKNDKLWAVLPSFLHNYCADNLQCLITVQQIAEVTAEHFADNEEAMDSTDASGECYPQVDEAGMESYASFLGGLSDHEGKHDFFTLIPIIRSIIKLLSSSTSEETISSVLDLLQELFEDEQVGNAYVDHNLVNILLENIKTWPSDLAASSLDLLALLSSHSSILPKILNPTSTLHTEVTTWFTTQPSPHHTATAALIYGNYCTTDENCLQLLSTTIPPVLVTLLSPSSPHKLLHAIIGCLRNLSVCQQAREQLIGLFLPEASCQLLLHLSSGSDHTVTPKLLSTLRLVTQGDEQSCARIGRDKELLQGLVKIAQISIVPALNIETTRLLSSIVRYAKDSAVVESIVDNDVTPLLLGLLNSPHPQLINEMLVALNLAAANRPPNAKLVEQIDSEFLAAKLADILEMENCPKEIKCNAVTLAYNVLEWKLTGITENFANSNLKQAILDFNPESDTSKQVLEYLN